MVMVSNLRLAFKAYTKKRGADASSLAPLCKAFALPEMSERATQTPHAERIYTYYIYPSHGTSAVALDSDISIEVAKFYTVKSQSA